jgi:hypothetical protein
MRRKRHPAAFWSCFTLCVIIAVVWLASVFVEVGCYIGDQAYSVGLRTGELTISANELRDPLRHRAAYYSDVWVYWHNQPKWTMVTWPQVGGPWVLGGYCVYSYRWTVYIPCWLLLGIAAIPTALLWWRRRRRYSPGHCRECGYNLTGNTSGRCPECGSPIQAPSAAVHPLE